MLDLNQQSGIYRIVVKRPKSYDKYYIGQTSNFKNRFSGHLRQLRVGKHGKRLQHAYLKYGKEAFRFEILLVCEKKKDILLFYEQLILDSYAPEKVYNVMLECVNSPLGTKASKERIENQRASMKKLCADPAYIKKLSDGAKSSDCQEIRLKKSIAVKNSLKAKAQLERLKADPVVRAKRSASLKERMADPEFRAICVAAMHTDKARENRRKTMNNPAVIVKTTAPHIGRKASLETKEKMSESARNRAPPTKETRALLSDIVRRREESEEYRNRRSAAIKLALADPVVRKKFSEAAKERWRQRKIRQSLAETELPII